MSKWHTRPPPHKATYSREGLIVLDVASACFIRNSGTEWKPKGANDIVFCKCGIYNGISVRLIGGSDAPKMLINADTNRET